MKDRPQADEAPPSPEGCIDDRGVDRSQIRVFLSLTPRERLRRSLKLAAFFARVRKQNAAE